MVGPDAEHSGIIRAGARVRRGHGHRDRAQAGPHAEPRVGRGLLRDGGAGLRPRLHPLAPDGSDGRHGGGERGHGALQRPDRQAQGRGEGPRRGPHTRMDEVREEYERQLDARFAAARGFVDEVVLPEELRPALSLLLRAANHNPARTSGRSSVPDIPDRRACVEPPLPNRPRRERPGLLGRRPRGPVRQVEGGPIDYLMLDYLAEVTMSIMQKQRSRDPSAGLRPRLRPAHGADLPGVRREGRARGHQRRRREPVGCAEALVEAGRRPAWPAARRSAWSPATTSWTASTSSSPGPRAPQHGDRRAAVDHPRSGAERERLHRRAPIVKALEGRGRHRHGPEHRHRAHLRAAHARVRVGDRRHDRIAAGVVAGPHQRVRRPGTGGNCLIDWWTIEGMADVGFPIVEVSAGRHFVVTKHEGTGGGVTRAVRRRADPLRDGRPRSTSPPTCGRLHRPSELEEVGPTGCACRREGAGRHRLPEGLHRLRGRVEGGGHARLRLAGRRGQGARRRAHPAGAPRPARPRVRRGPARSSWGGTRRTARSRASHRRTSRRCSSGRCRSDDRAAVERFTREIAPLVLTGPPSVTGFAGGRPRVQEIMAYWPALIRKEAVHPHLHVEMKDV
jgi:hypothetical protein